MFELLRDPAANVILAASSRDQAQICFDEARKIAMNDSWIASRVTVTRRELRTQGGMLKVISADSEKQLGLIPTRILVDELGSHPNDDLYNALRTSLLKVPHARMVTISTSAIHGEGVLWNLRERCLSQDHIHRDGPLTIATGEHIALIEYSLPADWPLERAVEANPASWITAEGLEEQRQAVPETAFRRFHCNQWVKAEVEPWLPDGAWAGCAADRRLVDGEQVVLAFDGSYSGDSTVLVACTLDEPHHVELLNIWKPDETGQTVAVADVEARILEACGRYDVLEISADPALWLKSLQALGDRLPVVAFPQSPSRMVPATNGFYQAVMNHELTHPDDPDLAAHVANAVRKPSGMISKPSKSSPRRIDAAVASVMALAAARAQPEPMVPLVAFR